MMKYIRTFYLFFMILLSSFSIYLSEDAQKANQCKGVSFVLLLGDNPNHNDKCVISTGVIMIGKEWSYLYLNSESASKRIILNSIGLGFNQGQREILNQYQGRYISISGIYENKSNSLSEVELIGFH